MADSASAVAGCPGLEDFKSLPNEKQSEEVFRLLSLLSPFASQVGTLNSWLSARFEKNTATVQSTNLLNPPFAGELAPEQPRRRPRPHRGAGERPQEQQHLQSVQGALPKTH